MVKKEKRGKNEKIANKTRVFFDQLLILKYALILAYKLESRWDNKKSGFCNDIISIIASVEEKDN